MQEQAAPVKRVPWLLALSDMIAPLVPAEPK